MTRGLTQTAKLARCIFWVSGGATSPGGGLQTLERAPERRHSPLAVTRVPSPTRRTRQVFHLVERDFRCAPRKTVSLTKFSNSKDPSIRAAASKSRHCLSNSACQPAQSSTAEPRCSPSPARISRANISPQRIPTCSSAMGRARASTRTFPPRAFRMSQRCGCANWMRRSKATALRATSSSFVQWSTFRQFARRHRAHHRRRRRCLRRCCRRRRRQCRHHRHRRHRRRRHRQHGMN